MTKQEERDLRAIAGEIADGRCVAFLGAAMSGGSMPTGRQLAECLLKQLAEDPARVSAGTLDLKTSGDYTLQDVGACYLKCYGQNGDAMLKQRIRQCFAGTCTNSAACTYRPHGNPTRACEILARLPLRFVVDYNFDDLFEKASRRAFRTRIQHVIRNDNELEAVVGAGALPNQQPSDVVYILKPHGDVNDPDNRHMVVTDHDYARLMNLKPTLMRTVADWMTQYPPLFLGYGLAEPDFRRTWIETYVSQMDTQLNPRCAYAITFGDPRRPSFEREFFESVSIVMIQRDLTATLEILARFVARRMLRGPGRARALSLIHFLSGTNGIDLLLPLAFAVIRSEIRKGAPSGDLLPQCCLRAVFGNNGNQFTSSIEFATQCGVLECVDDNFRTLVTPQEFRSILPAWEPGKLGLAQQRFQTHWRARHATVTAVTSEQDLERPVEDLVEDLTVAALEGDPRGSGEEMVVKLFEHAESAIDPTVRGRVVSVFSKMFHHFRICMGTEDAFPAVVVSVCWRCAALYHSLGLCLAAKDLLYQIWKMPQIAGDYSTVRWHMANAAYRASLLATVDPRVTLDDTMIDYCRAITRPQGADDSAPNMDDPVVVRASLALAGFVERYPSLADEVRPLMDRLSKYMEEQQSRSPATSGVLPVLNEPLS